jgi:alkyl hydroperoxide reductase subunit F
LIDAVSDYAKLGIHAPYEVVSFRGDDRLTGLRMRRVGARRTRKLSVDGVFLEIGLTPNSDPVRDLLPLNPRGEIPVRADRSTDLEGFFAAGDVTDVGEKQIAIAVGEGALAALSAHRYLVARELAVAKPGIDDDWV